MLKKLEGRVKNYRKLTNHQVQFELAEHPDVVHLALATPWALAVGDTVSVVGETDAQSGQFKGYCYLNQTKGVHGVAPEHRSWSWIVASLLFCWGIFPLFTHLPVGLRGLRHNNKRLEALKLLA